MKIVYMSLNGFPESASDSKGAFSLEHVKALKAEGAEVVAIDMQAQNFTSNIVESVEIIRIPRLRAILANHSICKILKYIESIRNIRNSSYDCLIFSFFYIHYLPFIWLLKKRNTTVVVIAHGAEVMPGGLLRRALKRLMFKSVNLVTPVSDYTATLFSCLITRKNSDTKKIKTIYNGIDLQKIDQKVNECVFDPIISNPAKNFIVLSIGNLVKRKGIDIIVRAVDHLILQGRNVHHVIIGTGPELIGLKELARKNGNSENFHFITNIKSSEIGSYYRASNLFALMSRTDWDNRQTEGFGIVYAEAMAAGIPVIGGAECGATTPIQQGFTGILVNADQHDVVDQVSTIIARFADDVEHWNLIARNAKTFARSEFNWKKNAQATLSAIHRAHQ